MPKKKVTISIDSKIYDSFQKYCEENAIMLSKRLELFMKELVKKKISTAIIPILFMLSLVSASTIYTDGFESGSLTGWTLSNSGGVNFVATTTNPYQGNYHAQTVATGITEPGSVMSKIVSTSGFNSIYFSYYRKLVGLDTADEFQAEWFDGTTWTILEQTGSSSANDAGYVLKSFLLPESAANNPNFSIKFECTTGAVSEFCRIDNVNITGTVVDASPPIFADYRETPSNSTPYSPNSRYEFNATITESNLNKYGIEFNGINYTAIIKASGNVYSFNISDLPAGTYSYYWWANDTNGNFNTSGLRHYTISKASPTLNLYLNSVQDNLTIQYPQELNISASANYGTISLYLNGIDITASNSRNLSLASGYYNITAYSSSTQNYSASSKTLFANITKGDNIITLLLNSAADNLTLSYLEQLNASAYSSGGLVSLFREDAIVTNSQNLILAAGYYEFFANSTGNQNYSANPEGVKLYANITKISPESNMHISLTPSSTVIYGTQTSATASNSNNGDSDLVYYFYRNNLTIANPNTESLSSGSYLYEYNTSGGQNYTSGRIISILTITPRGNPVSLFLNGLASNLTIQYPSQLNVSGSSPSNSLSLFKDSIDMTSSNSKNLILSSGYYEFFANSTGNQNYAPNSTGIKYYANITKAGSSVQLYINNSRSDLNATTQDVINITAYRISGEGKIYLYLDEVLINQGISTTYNSSIFASEGMHNITVSYPETENYTASSETFWINVTEAPDTQGPSITIAFPEDKIYSYNESLPLNFSVYDNSGIDSCWYSIDESANLSIPGCVNITFDVVEDGYFQLRLFANDSLGNVASRTRDFGVITSAPAINIIFPKNNSYLNYNKIFFNYTAESALALSSCYFYSDFNGTWALNDSNTSITQTQNYFFADLEEGSYNWMISCNDSGNKRSNISYSLFIDATSPLISLSEPSGSKSSRTINAIWSATDTNLASCWYNVYRGANLEIYNTSVTCSSNSTTFSTTLDAEFTFNFFVNDSAGNTKYSSLNFSVSTLTPYIPPAGGGGGGGGGGAGPVILGNSTKNHKYDLEFNKLSSLIIQPGETRRLQLGVKNSGKEFLNDCKLQGIGEYRSWIASEGTKGLSSGELSDYAINIKIPGDIKPGEYNISLEISCREYSESFIINSEYLENKLKIRLIDVKREGKESIAVKYLLSELAGQDQVVEINIALFNSKNEKIAEVISNKAIKENSITEFRDIIKIPASAETSLSLIMNANSDIASATLKESIMLGNLKLGGLAIFVGEGKSDKILAGFLVLAFGIFAFFMVRRICMLRKHVHVKKKVLVSFKNEKKHH